MLHSHMIAHFRLQRSPEQKMTDYVRCVTYCTAHIGNGWLILDRGFGESALILFGSSADKESALTMLLYQSAVYGVIPALLKEKKIRLDRFLNVRTFGTFTID
jgi:hypothetical protein